MTSSKAWLWAILLATLVATPALRAQDGDDASAPETTRVDVGLEEQVGVHLVLIDTVVVDRAGRTVPDLTVDDFELVVDGKVLPIDTLDVGCENAVDDPVGVSSPRKRAAIPAPEHGRKLVLTFDYMHTAGVRRAEVLAHAKDMVRHGLTAGDEVMIAALAGGLRVEQAFTQDPDRLLESLNRMEYDISLWNQDFRHLTEEPFFSGLEALFEVLGMADGSKGVVLFSDAPGTAAENDLYFERVAALASSSRCAIYPVAAAGLIAKPG